MYVLSTDERGALTTIENVDAGVTFAADPDLRQYRDMRAWIEANMSPMLDLAMPLPPEMRIFLNRHALTTHCRRHGVLLFATGDEVPYWRDFQHGNIRLCCLSTAQVGDCPSHDARQAIVARDSNLAVLASEWARINSDLADQDSDVRHVSSLPVIRCFLYFDISDFSQYAAFEQALIINSLNALVGDAQLWDGASADLYRCFKTALCIGDGYIFVFDEPVEAVLFAAHLAMMIEKQLAIGALPVEFHFRMGAHVGPTYSFWETGREGWNYVGDGINGGNRVLVAVGKDQDDVVFISSAVRSTVHAATTRDTSLVVILNALTNRGRKSDKHGRPWRVYELNHVELCEGENAYAYLRRGAPAGSASHGPLDTASTRSGPSMGSEGDKDPARIAQNWAQWLHIHRLDADFPSLHPLMGQDFDHRFFERPVDEVGVTAVLTAALGAPRTQVEFAAGHGVTTMFRAVLRKLTSAYESIRRVHVAIDLADYNADKVCDEFWRDIRRAVFAELVGSNLYGGLYGARRQSFQMLFDRQGYATFDDYLTAAANSVHNSPRDPVRHSEALQSLRYDDNVASLGALFAYLFDELGVATVVLFDVASSASEDTLFALMGEVKSIDEQVRVPPAAVSEVYFGSASSLSKLRGTYHRDYHRLVVPPYNPAELFAILAKHYGSGAADSLIAILHASYVDAVWSSTKPIVTMMDDLRNSLLSRLDCPREHVSYGMFQDAPSG